MTRRGGKEASERSRRIGEDERQPVMVQPSARWRRSNLVKMVKCKCEGTEEIERKTPVLRPAL